jgi:hypothetical protein
MRLRLRELALRSNGELSLYGSTFLSSAAVETAQHPERIFGGISNNHAQMQ